MITIILEDKSSVCLQKIALPGNEKVLLCPNLKHLGSLDSFSYSVFSKDEMDELIDEVNIVRQGISDEAMIAHLNEIVKLALLCKNKSGTTLTFTPFGDLG